MPPGPRCFTSRVLKEPKPEGTYQLPRGTKYYDGNTNPDDWLTDYAHAVHIANGNLRWAIRCIPQMLEGPARIWLNNLPEGSVNGWVEFRKMFITNFSSTYKRPNRPQALRDCKQGEHETDREYLTRWCTIRNTCEGVEEKQAIGWFTEGCKYGSMLWQKYRRAPPKNLAETIEIANAYAQADPTKPRSAAGPNQYSAGHDVAEGSRQQDRPDYRNKRKEGNRYNPTFVGAVQNTPAPDSKSHAKRMASKKKYTWDNAIGQKEWGEPRGASSNLAWNYEAMLDQPCALHTQPGERPSGHTTRQCS